ARRRLVPVPRHADVDVEKALRGIVAGPATLELTHVEPERQQLVLRKRQVRGQSLRVHRAEGGELPAPAHAVVEGRAAIAGEKLQRPARPRVDVAEQLDEARRDVSLADVSPRAQDVAQVVDRGVVVASVRPEVLHLHVLVQRRIEDLEPAVPHHEEARLGGDRPRREPERAGDDGPPPTNAPTWPASASRIRMVVMSMRSSGSCSGSNQSSSSDSSPQTRLPARITHSNTLLT